MASAPKAYLTFRVARREMAVEAACVRGILPPRELIPLPEASELFLGVAPFAGRMVLVIDLARVLGLARAPAGAQPKIVIAEAASTLAGFLVDRVSDVAVYRGRNLHNGLLKGIGRPRRLIHLDTLFAGQPLRPSNACSISCLASGVIAVNGNRGGPP